MRLAPLPEQVVGRHQWLLSSYHVLSDGQASAFKNGAVVRLDERNRVDVSDVVCRFCHGHYPGLEFCPGEPQKQAPLVVPGRA